MKERGWASETLQGWCPRSPEHPQYINPISMDQFFHSAHLPHRNILIWQNLLFQHFLYSFCQLSIWRKEDEDLKLCKDDALAPLSTPNTSTQYLWTSFSTAPICRTVIWQNLLFQHFLPTIDMKERGWASETLQGWCPRSPEHPQYINPISMDQFFHSAHLPHRNMAKFAFSALFANYRYEGKRMSIWNFARMMP